MNRESYIITAGATYLDIDAYACAVSLAELMRLRGENAVAYSEAPFNYSVCPSLADKGGLLRELPKELSPQNARYIIVDVSDRAFLDGSVPLGQVAEIFDHHAGFEEYWEKRIGEKAHIEFIGAAATLIYREWKKYELQDKMCRSTVLLMIAAILDNTLNLKSSNTTEEDREAFSELCLKENIGYAWCEAYFSEVQASVEAELEASIFNDIKKLENNPVLPPVLAQLCVWDSSSVISRLSEVRRLFAKDRKAWMVNIIDIKSNCCFFLCDAPRYQRQIEKVFRVSFRSGVAKTEKLYLRKEIIKKTLL